MTEVAITRGETATPSDPEALRLEIALVREDLAQNIRQLRDTLDVRAEVERTLRAHPRVVLGALALAGGLLALAVGRIVRNARRRRALNELIAARTRRSWWLRG